MTFSAAHLMVSSIALSKATLQPGVADPEKEFAMRVQATLYSSSVRIACKKRPPWALHKSKLLADPRPGMKCFAGARCRDSIKSHAISLLPTRPYYSD